MKYKSTKPIPLPSISRYKYFHFLFIFISLYKHATQKNIDYTYKFTFEEFIDTFELKGHFARTNDLEKNFISSAKDLQIIYEDENVYEIISVFDRIRIDKIKKVVQIQLSRSMVLSVENLEKF